MAVEIRFGAKASLAVRRWCRTSPACWRTSRGCSRRAGFNIDSLAVGETENPHLSRITVVVMGDDRHLDQVRKQLEKIVTVVKVHDISREDYVERDLMLIKIDAPPGASAGDQGAGADLPRPDRGRQSRPVDDRDLRPGEEDRGVHRAGPAIRNPRARPDRPDRPGARQTGRSRVSVPRARHRPSKARPKHRADGAGAFRALTVTVIGHWSWSPVVRSEPTDRSSPPCC